MSKALQTPDALARGKYLVDSVTGCYSESDLWRVLNEGIGKAGQTSYAMPWRYYAGMTDLDKHALIMALRTALAVVNVVPLPTFAR
jgi:hypothetical protein